MMSRKQLLSFVAMMLLCSIGFAQKKDVIVVRQTDGTELRFDVDRTETLLVKAIDTAIEPEYVDLGLSVKWATCNLGASKPEECGEYYGWGCTEPYDRYDDVLISLYFKKIGGKGTELKDFGSNNDPLIDYVYSNSKDITGTKWDAARQKLGGEWRMPTNDEVSELHNNCDWEWIKVNGVYGRKYTSRVPGYTDKSIFFPAAGGRQFLDLLYKGSAGYYWTSTPNSSSGAFSSAARSESAHVLGFSNGNYPPADDRFLGFSVRPVID